MKWMERHQVALYVAGLGVGAGLGTLLPEFAGPATAAITPLLALMLYVTFLGVPFMRLGRAFADWRFIGAILVINFLLAPASAWLVSRWVAQDHVLLVGTLFVLLTPCIDYVLVFSALAGADRGRLLAATPLLMLAQMALLPLYLWLFVGEEFAASVDPQPFVEAFLTMIVAPLVAAALTQLAAARWRAGRQLEQAGAAIMVPLMAVTLAVVVASQIPGVRTELSVLLQTVPVFLGFAALMVPAGMLAGRVAGLDTPGRRAAVFSGVTRNSLVVLPLVLALPAANKLAPLVVVTQTLTELAIMVALVRLVPRWVD